MLYLKFAANHLQSGHVMALAGCFSGEREEKSWLITGGTVIPECTDLYTSNAQEADMRIWRHANVRKPSKFLICSPDTNVYSIGLLFVNPSWEIKVQTNLLHHPQQYIDLNKSSVCFQCDPCLASIIPSKLNSIFLQLYIVTGCDYTSYFTGIGKATFLKIFFENSEFITGTGMVGCLLETNILNQKSGFYAFIRLVGTVYFKKNLASVVSKLNIETPVQLFNSLGCTTDHEPKHTEWYNLIKKAYNPMNETQQLPTLTALNRHWMRCCWIKEMWKNS